MYKKQEKELQNVVFDLINSSSTVFYGLFLTEVGKFFDKRVPTACLAKHKEAKIPVMLFNPDFWSGLTNKQQKFLVLHETHHLINQAFLFSNEFGLESPLDNIAMDLNINSILTINYENEVEFIEGGQLPKNFPELAMAEQMDSLYYYNILKKAKDKKQESKEKGEDSQSPCATPGNGNGTSGCPNLDDMLDNQEKIDQHTTWGELTAGMSDIEKEVLKRDVISRLEKIAEEVSKQHGNIPMNVQGMLNKIQKIKQTVNWKALLRKFIGSSVSSEVLSNRKRPSKRFEENPSTKYKLKVNGVFLADSSGSVGDDDLAKCNAELYNVFKAGGNIDYASWDQECEETKKYDGKLEIIRTKCGGTNMDCALREINKNYKKKGWNFAVVTTDGHVGETTVKTRIPTLVIITPNGDVNFDNPYKYKVIKMNG